MEQESQLAKNNITVNHRWNVGNIQKGRQGEKRERDRLDGNLTSKRGYFHFPKASLQLNLLLFLAERVHSSCSEKREREGRERENQGEEAKASLVLQSLVFFSVLMGKKRNEKLTLQISVTGKLP